MSTCCNFTSAIQATNILDPLVISWRAAADAYSSVVFGTTLSNATVSAVNTWYKSFKAHATLPGKMIMLNPCAPDNVAAVFTPLIDLPGGTRPWQMQTPGGPAGVINANCNVTVNGGRCDFALRGIFNYMPSTMWASRLDTGITIYRYSDDGAHGGHVYDYGCSNGANNMWEATFGAFGNWYWNAYDQATQISPPSNNLSGYLSWNISGANNWRLYFANNSHPHSAVITNDVNAHISNFPAFEIPAIGVNDNNVYAAVPSRLTSFIAFHTSLTAAESLDLYNFIVSLRTSLGGGLAA